jgi:hypothetical protein
MRGLPVSAEASAKQIAVGKLLGWVSALGLPVLDLHIQWPLWIRAMQ